MGYKTTEDATAYQREWTEKNRGKRNEINRRSKARQFEKYREWKDGLSCGVCGENHPATLHLHHTNPDEKDFSLARAARGLVGWDRLMKEAAKCEVLCANCHAKHHWTEPTLP